MSCAPVPGLTCEYVTAGNEDEEASKINIITYQVCLPQEEEEKEDGEP